MDELDNLLQVCYALRFFDDSSALQDLEVSKSVRTTDVRLLTADIRSAAPLHTYFLFV